MVEVRSGSEYLTALANYEVTQIKLAEDITWSCTSGVFGTSVNSNAKIKVIDLNGHKLSATIMDLSIASGEFRIIFQDTSFSQQGEYLNDSGMNFINFYKRGNESDTKFTLEILGGKFKDKDEHGDFFYFENKSDKRFDVNFIVRNGSFVGGEKLLDEQGLKLGKIEASFINLTYEGYNDSKIILTNGTNRLNAYVDASRSDMFRDGVQEKDFNNSISIYKNKKIEIEAKNKHVVTFLDYNDNVIQKFRVVHGSVAVPPVIPPRIGYTFIGWDKELTNVTSDLTIKPQYDINKYKVTFTNYNNNVLKTQVVEHGANATAPENPTRSGYTFIGWDKEFTNVKDNLTVKAQYDINKYTVTFVDHDNTVLKSEVVEHGKEATAPEEPTRFGYTFTGWDKGFANVTSNLTVKAIFEEKLFYTYQIISGANQTWEQGSKKDVVIRIDAPKDKFERLEYFGGQIIDKKNYKIEEGSTIITIFAEYLETLDAGQKVLHILYSDYDPIQTTFTIKAKASESDNEQITPEQPKEEDPKEEEKPKDAEKPVESEKDKLPGMGDNYFLGYLALLLIVLGSIFTIKSKPQE